MHPSRRPTFDAVNVSIAFFVLSLLIGATPLTLVFEGPLTHGLVAATAAAGLAIVALRIRPGEAGYLTAVIRPLALIGAIPAAWMAIQGIPFGIFAHPIWASAAAAVGRPMAGSISIDTGATLISLGWYLATAATALLATAVALDRQRAERLLLILTAATTLVAVLAVYVEVRGLAFLKAFNPALTKDAATVSAALGTILALTMAVRMFERYETRRVKQRASARRIALTSIACVAAILICSSAVALGGGGQAIFAVACGIVCLAAVVVIRRFGLGPWGYAAVGATALVVAVSVVALLPRGIAVAEDLTLKFAVQADGQQLAFAQRVLAETRWSGTGAGTYAAVAPIYRDVDELSIDPAAPTAAAAVAEELGRAALWLITAAAIYLIMLLLRRALRRGRDSFYPAAGASCLVTLTLLAFGNAGLLSATVSIFAAAILGMAFAQSESRAIR